MCGGRKEEDQESKDPGKDQEGQDENVSSSCDYCSMPSQKIYAAGKSLKICNSALFFRPTFISVYLKECNMKICHYSSFFVFSFLSILYCNILPVPLDQSIK